MDCLKALRELKKINPQAKYVMMTGAIINEALLMQVKSEGVEVCLMKPFEINELREQINTVRINLKRDF